METDEQSRIEARVLLLAPTLRDAEITRTFLAEAGLSCVSCSDLADLCAQVRRGCGAVLLTEEAVASAQIEELIHILDEQPAWSDLPLVMLMRGGTQSAESTRVLKLLRNITLLERPTQRRSVLSAIEAAVRARKRQYEARRQIEDIRRAEALHKELQEQLEIAVEASELGTFHCEIPLGKIIWNTRCKEHFWLPADADVDFDLFYSILHPDDRERTRSAIEACVYRGQAYDIEYRTVSPSGQIRWVRATGRTFSDRNGSPLRFDGTTQDITARIAAAEEREKLLVSEQAARAESERAGRMKDDFLATLSHELRTPLNAILGWSMVMRRTPDAQTLSEGLEVIERNARMQVQLIEDLLDMSRIISGKLRLELKPTDPLPPIAAAIDTVMPTAAAKGVQIVRTLEAGHTTVLGDETRLQQIVWNLLCNGVKFTPKGGHIRISVAAADNQLEITVSDTGKGIESSFLPYIFERFRQADASTTRQYGGLGLGLAIVKQLVEMHGGSVSAASDGTNRGSTFTVSLPLLEDEWNSPKTEPRTAAAEDSLALELKDVSVLVVDDERDARGLIKRVLEEHGARVTMCGSGAEAIQLVPTVRPDVLVSDIGMPQMDGYEMLRRVRELGAARRGDVPAIAVSALARSEDRSRALREGFSVYVAKPVEPYELVATVARIRNGETALKGSRIS